MADDVEPVDEGEAAAGEIVPELATVPVAVWLVEPDEPVGAGVVVVVLEWCEVDDGFDAPSGSTYC